jgi:2-oxoisovalerate dehydrogenase E1 component beta subunit
LLASIEDPNPVLFMEPKILYRSARTYHLSQQHRLFSDIAAVEQVPIDAYTLPLGKAEILTQGSDLTIVSYGTPIYTILNSMSLLESPPPSLSQIVPSSLRGAKIELIDLRTIMPWDVETVVASVKKTGRCMIVHEAGVTGGVGGEIAAELQKRCFERLEAPVKRVCGWEYVLLPLIFKSC